MPRLFDSQMRGRDSAVIVAGRFAEFTRRISGFSAQAYLWTIYD